MKKILLTGSNGFLGEEIISELREDYELILIDKDENHLKNLGSKSIFYKIDIRSKNELIKVFQNHKIDIILHCAAELLDEKNADKVWQTNYNGTNNILDLADEFKIEKFIFTSTFSLFEKNYDVPINEKELPSAIVDYGRSKYAAENLILRHNYSGDVVIFPGWVHHSTTPNESDEPRLMIGANYWLRGNMQFFDELDRINI